MSHADSELRPAGDQRADPSSAGSVERSGKLPSARRVEEATRVLRELAEAQDECGCSICIEAHRAARIWTDSRESEAQERERGR